MTNAGLSSSHNVTYSGYDQAGSVTQYRMDMYEGTAYTNYYNYTHARYEGYREATLSGTSTELDPGQTTYQYDVNGNLVGWSTQGRQQEPDAGERRQRQDPATGAGRQDHAFPDRQRRAAGHDWPDGGRGRLLAVLPSHRRRQPAGQPGSYRIQPGDTLQTIAQQAYGDSRLWFLVAEANGLASDRDLRVGATVTIPNRVSGNHNDYKTFKPYDPGKLIGDTQPTMPVPEADGGGLRQVWQFDPGGGCGGGDGVYGGALAAPAGATLGGMMNLGVSVLAGTSISGIGAVGIGLAAGAVGSAVSQGVGMALGMQSKFSWGSVAMGALGSGVMAGVGGAFNGASFLSGNRRCRSPSRPASPMARRRQRHADGGAGDGQLDGDAGHRDGDGAAVQVQLDQCGGCRRGRGVGAGVGGFVGGKLFPTGNEFSTNLMRGFASSAVGGVAATVLTGANRTICRLRWMRLGMRWGIRWWSL